MSKSVPAASVNARVLNRQSNRRRVWLLSAIAPVAVAMGATSAMAANGTASFIDFNGATAGFGTPGGTISETALIWSTSNAGTNATTARPTSSQLTIGNVATDFAGQTFSINLDGGGNLNGVLINSSSANVTFTGTSNTHPNAAQTWTITAGSTLTVNDTRQTFADTVKGMNWNNQAVTFQGGGTINFPTPFGANSTATNTENMSGGVINLQMGAITSAATYTGGYVLTSGTLNFASAGSANQFNGTLSTKTFAINGGILDNTTASPITMNLGAGTYTIGGDFAFTGTNALNLGAAAVAVTGNRTVTVNANTLQIDGAITNAAASTLTKAGAGTLKLTAANTYTGNVTVSAGTLDVASVAGGYSLGGTQSLISNATVAGNVISGSGTAVRGAGAYSNSVTVSGGTLAPGNVAVNNGVGTMTVGSLTMNSGTLAVDLSGATGDLVNVTGTADFTGFSGTGISITTPAPLTAGTYQILTAGSLVNGSALTLATTQIGRTHFAIDNAQLANNIVQLDVTGSAANLVWTGTDGGSPSVWDNAGTIHNWTGTGVGDTTVFFDGDQVTFDGTNTGPSSLTINGNVSPGSVNVTAGNYTFGGGGSIIGTAAVTVGSGASLTLATANAYTGGTTVSGGSLGINNAAALGTGALTLNGGATIDNTSGGAVTLATAIPINVGGDVTFVGSNDLNLSTGAVTLNASPTITVSAGNLTIGGVISGAGKNITKAGSGTLILGASNSFSGGLTINGGAVQSNTNNVGTTALGSGNVTVNAGGTLIGGNKDAFGFAPNAAPATIFINAGGTVTDLVNGAYRVTLPNLTFTGGTLTSASGNTGDASGNYSFLGNGTTATITTNASSSTATISAAAVSMQKPTTFNVAAGTAPGGIDLLVSSIIVVNGTNALTKSGAGVMQLTGNNTYTATTTVSAGTLALASSTSTNNIPASPTVTVASGATLDVTGITAAGGFTLAGTQTLVNNGTVSGTATAAATGQTLTGTGTYAGNVTVSGGVLTPGTATVIGTMASISNLTVSGSGLLSLKFNGASSDQITSVTGTASFAADSSIKIVQQALPTSSSYTILTAGTLSGLSAGTVATFGRTVYSVDGPALASNILKLDVVGAPASDVWTGADTGTDPTRWDNVQTNANWLASGPVADMTHFYDGDAVTFDSVNNNGQFGVNISGTVTPGSVTVTNGSASTYTIGGGGIAGAGSLTMNSSEGTGSLTLTATNTYTGGTIIQSGTVNANATGALGTGPVTLNGGRLNLGTTGAMGTATLTLAGGTIDNTSGGAITLANNPESWAGSFTFAGSNALSTGTGAVTINAANPTVTVTAGTLTVGGAIGNGTGNSFTKAGAGTLILSAASGYTGTTTITGGVVKFGSNVSTAFGPLTGGAVIINGGTFDVSGNTTANNLNFGAKQFQIAGNGGGLGAIENAGGVAQQNAFQNVVLSADATINGTGAAAGVTNTGRMDIRGGTPTLDLQGHTLTKTGSSQFTLVAATVTAGNINVASPGAVGSAFRNTLGIETTSTVAAATKPDSSPSTITFNDNTNLELFQTAGTVTRQMVFNGDVLVSNGNATALSTVGSPITNNGVLSVDAALSGAGNIGPITLNGVISGAGSVVKNAASTLTLGGANTYTGNTTVNAGTLTLGATGSLASANLTANTGATVNLNGTVASMSAIIASGGTVNFPGNTGTGAFARTAGAVSVGTNGLVKIAASAFPATPTVLTVASTAFTDASSKLDLTNNELVVKSTTLATVVPQITANNITSTSTGGGVGSLQVGPDVEVRFTLLGDTNLDGHVDVTDLGNLASSYGATTGAIWVQGDTNYDGSVDVTDLGNLASNYGGNLASGPSAGAAGAMLAGSLAMVASSGSSAVPEPTSLGLIGISAIGLLARRRRRA